MISAGDPKPVDTQRTVNTLCGTGYNRNNNNYTVDQCVSDVEGNVNAVQNAPEKPFDEKEASRFNTFLQNGRQDIYFQCLRTLQTVTPKQDISKIGVNPATTKAFVTCASTYVTDTSSNPEPNRVLESNNPDDQKFARDNHLIIFDKHGYSWSDFVRLINARARLQIIPSAEYINIPPRLQDLINNVRGGKDAYKDISPENREAVAGDLERMFRQAVGQVTPNSQRTDAAEKVGDDIVSKVKPRIDALAGAPTDEAKKEGVNDIIYLFPAGVGAGPEFKINWREAPKVKGEAPDVAAERRRLYHQAWIIYDGKGGSDDAALKAALDKALATIPPSQLADALANYDVKDVAVDGNKKATEIKIGPRRTVPDDLIQGVGVEPGTVDGPGRVNVENERVRAVKGIWNQAIDLMAAQNRTVTGPVRRKMIDSLVAQFRGKPATFILMNNVASVEPSGEVKLQALPGSLINAAMDLSQIVMPATDGAVGAAAVTRKYRELFNQARELRDKDTRPNVKAMTDEQLSERVQKFGRGILYATSDNAQPDATRFLLPSTKITGIEDNGDMIGTVGDPNALGGGDDAGIIWGDPVNGMIAYTTEGSLGGGFVVPSERDTGGIFGGTAGIHLGYHKDSIGTFGVNVAMSTFGRSPLMLDAPSAGGESLNTVVDNGGYYLVGMSAANLFYENGWNDDAQKLNASVGLRGVRLLNAASSGGMDEDKLPFTGWMPLAGGANSRTIGLVVGADLGFLRGQVPFGKPEDKSYGFVISPRLVAGSGFGSLLAYDFSSQKFVNGANGYRVGGGAILDYHAGVAHNLSQDFDARLGFDIQTGEGTNQKDKTIERTSWLLSANLMYRPIEHFALNAGGWYGQAGGTDYPHGNMQTFAVGGGIDSPWRVNEGKVKLNPFLRVGYQRAWTPEVFGGDRQSDGGSTGIADDYGQGKDPTQAYALPAGMLLGQSVVEESLGLQVCFRGDAACITPTVFLYQGSDIASNDGKDGIGNGGGGMLQLEWRYGGLRK